MGAACEARAFGQHPVARTLCTRLSKEPGKIFCFSFLQLKFCDGLIRPDFSFAGIKVHHLECAECGNKATRDFQPGKGYS